MRLLRIRELGRRDVICQQAVELVTDYLEGTLSRTARRRFEAHLAGCPHCTEYLAQMRETINLAGRIEPEDLPRKCETSSWTCSGAGSPNSSEHGRQPQGAGQRQQDHGGQLVAPGELERVRADQQHDRRQRHTEAGHPSRRASRRTSPASDPATPATSAAACSGPAVYPPSSW